MISIIICSRSPEQLAEAEAQLASTVGCDYEVIAFDNRTHGYGICKVYNLCAEKAKYPYLCFVHEDVRLHTPDWGKSAADFFKAHPQAGLLGVAGMGYLSDLDELRFIPPAYILRVRMPHRQTGQVVEYRHPAHLDEAFRVAVLDGLLLITPKSVWQSNRFDETTFDGFHLYDLDFSMQVARRYEVWATTAWDTTHFSLGTYNETHKEEYRKFYKKWRNHLPAVTFPACTTETDKMDIFLWQAYQSFKRGAIGGGLKFLYEAYGVSPYQTLNFPSIWYAAGVRIKAWGRYFEKE